MLRDLSELVPSGALVVLNDTRVRRARAFVSKQGTGGGAELLFLAPVRSGAGGGAAPSTATWRALGRANRPLKPGLILEADGLEATIVAALEGGVLEVETKTVDGLEAWLERHGHVPLPPYLGRNDEPEDGERYQTVFAEHVGSAAAPTAGLHLSQRVLAELDARGVERATLTLDIGLGTFRPVDVEDLDRHPMHAETFRVKSELVRRIRAARARGAPVVAVGTTVVRALESAADPERPGEVVETSGETRLLIQPGYRFRVVDALLTNFHQPRSTLLALVSAFAGRDAVLTAYRDAIRTGYRFLSYGDAMWLPRHA